MDPGEPLGLADAVAFGQVLQDGEGLLGGELGAEEGRPLVLGEAGLAGATVQEPEVVMLAEVATDAEVVAAPSPVAWAVGVLATEACEVVRGHDASWGQGVEPPFGRNAPG
jgi:hypothetical protein